jgi:hypothetical protein
MITLFGGQDNRSRTVFGDTWEWDGSDWLQRSPLLAPSPRWGHAMAHDSRRGRTVLFGGGDQSATVDDTWEWDGFTWRVVLPPTRPGPRYGHAMAFDEKRGVVVLFGGAYSITELGDTWEWDGAVWTRRATSAAISARLHHRMVYDVARERILLFGGSPSPGSYLSSDDTWEWDGRDWTLRAPATKPARRCCYSMAYDRRRATTVLVGGYGWASNRPPFLPDHWEYGPVHPAGYSAFGAGCAGTAGTPTLSTVGLPWLGDTLGIVLNALPSGAPALVELGLSDTAWAGLALPLGLGAIGMPGCALLVSPDDWCSATTSGTTAVCPIPIPLDVGLLGARFFNQGVVLDPGANALGLTVTNGGAGTIGAR